MTTLGVDCENYLTPQQVWCRNCKMMMGIARNPTSLFCRSCSINLYLWIFQSMHFFTEQLPRRRRDRFFWKLIDVSRESRRCLFVNLACVPHPFDSVFEGCSLFFLQLEIAVDSVSAEVSRMPLFAEELTGFPTVGSSLSMYVHDNQLYKSIQFLAVICLCDPSFPSQPAYLWQRSEKRLKFYYSFFLPLYVLQHSSSCSIRSLIRNTSLPNF